MSLMEQTEAIYYAEVYEILKYLGKSYIEAIPRKLLETIDNVRSREYVFHIDETKPLNEQNFRQETKDFIAALNLIYWEKDEEKKQKLMQIYKENDIIYEKEQQEKYSYDNLFKNRQKPITSVEEEEKEKVELIVPEKQSIIQKIINKIKNIFRRGK